MMYIHTYIDINESCILKKPRSRLWASNHVEQVTRKTLQEVRKVLQERPGLRPSSAIELLCHQPLAVDVLYLQVSKHTDVVSAIHI